MLVTVLAAAFAATRASAASASAATTPAATTPTAASAANPWASVFAILRPVQRLDSHRVIVTFDHASLGQRVARAPHGKLSASAQQAFVAAARADQNARLARLQQAGFAFDIRHRYLRVLDGVSLVLQSDNLARLASQPGIVAVTPVTTVYPAGTAAAAAVANASATAPQPGATAPVVALLDTAVDFNQSYLTAAQAAPTFNAIDGQLDSGAGPTDGHGTQMAGAALAAASGNVRLASIRVLTNTPVIGGYDAVLGTSDDLLAGFERAVDLDGNGDTSDHARSILVAADEPYASFSDSPLDQAVAAAADLGSLTVAASGDDGSINGAVGSVGAPGASPVALTVGAADLRREVNVVDLHVTGGVDDAAVAAAPVLSQLTTMPAGQLHIVDVPGAAGSAIDYYDTDLHSTVSGSVALIARSANVEIATQVRAAADAGAVAVLLAGDNASAISGTVAGAGVTIPVVAVSNAQASALRTKLSADARGTLISFSQAYAVANPDYGTVTDFSSRGASYDGSRVGPDVVAPGVAVHTTDVPDVANAGATGVVTYAWATGSSVAAAQVAGQVATIAAAHPTWSVATLRAAAIDTATQLGTATARPSVIAQGGGVFALSAASDAQIVATPARLDFGQVTPGSTAKVAVSLASVEAGAAVPTLASLHDETGDAAQPRPYVAANGLLAIDVSRTTTPGVYGGWLHAEKGNWLVPWTVVVRPAADLHVPIQASLDTHAFAAAAQEGEYPATLTVSVGDSAAPAGALQAAQTLQVHLLDASGKHDLGTLISRRDVLPGVYHVGISGRDANGAPLEAGTYGLQVQTVPAADPSSAVQTSSVVQLHITAG